MTIEQIISNDEKRSFLKWFLRHYQLKSRECVWLLNYMISDDHMIGLLKFVDSLNGCPRAMMISEKNVNDEAFVFYKNGIETREPEKAFHDIRMDQDETIFIRLNFPNSSRSSEYVSILEENPFEGRNLHDRYGREVDEMLEHSQANFIRKRLIDEIDQALDQKDEVRFQELVEELKKISDPQKEY